MEALKKQAKQVESNKIFVKIQWFWENHKGFWSSKMAFKGVHSISFHLQTPLEVIHTLEILQELSKKIDLCIFHGSCHPATPVNIPKAFEIDYK